MNSIIRGASRLASRSIFNRTLLVKPIVVNNHLLNRRWAHNQPLTYDFVRERILLLLRLFDKVDPEKLTLDSHFKNDLGLDSLDLVEIIVHLENEFLFEIPDKDAEKLVTPGHLLQYITDKEEAYEELQHMGHDDHHIDEHQSHGSLSPGDYNATINHQQTRPFSTSSKVCVGADDDSPPNMKFRTSFHQPLPDYDSLKIEDVQARVLKVCSKYDKIDASKLALGSHFVEDLGLDSLDHVEIMMELEDEFGLEIPDKEAEKLMRPAEIAKYIFHKEEARILQPEERPL